MKQEEAHIQKSIVQWLLLHHYWFCSIPNELGGKEAAIRTARAKTLGLRSGAPDLLVFLSNGVTYHVEVKTPTGKQSESQINFESRLKQLNHKYFVVRSLEEVSQLLENGELR